MKGTCRFCGQIIMVEDGFDQETANAQATAECSCPEGKLFRDNTAALEDIYEICTNPGESCFRNMTEEEADNILALASSIMDGLFDLAELYQGESKIVIARNRKGRLEFERSRTVELSI